MRTSKVNAAVYFFHFLDSGIDERFENDLSDVLTVDQLAQSVIHLQSDV